MHHGALRLRTDTSIASMFCLFFAMELTRARDSGIPAIDWMTLGCAVRVIALS